MGDIDEMRGDNNPISKSVRHVLESSSIDGATSASPPRKQRQLEPYELEALRLFASGRSADEMATELSVSKSMAHHYLRIAGRKLGARNRVHAVALAVRMGLVKPTRLND
jgi:DNA-binding CsgD family transcriptional regulator